MWARFGWMVAGLLAGGPDPSTSAPLGTFQRWFDSAVEGSLEVPPKVAREARSFRYVFVEGYRNERMPGYFAANIAELKALGVPRNRVHVIEPSSRATNEANAETVRDRFLKIAREGPERLVVIAHSRGACDALAFALDHPAFVRERVRALFLIQGPFGGSGLAGYVTGSGVPMDRRMKWKHRVIAGLIGRVARAFSGDESLEAMEGMSPEASAAFWARALDKDRATLAEVGSKSFFIRAALHPSKQRSGRRALAWYLHAYHGPNDGVVALDDQSLPGFGTVIADVEAGHSDLTCNRPTSRKRRGDRKALTRSIVMAVGQPGSAADPSAIEIRGSKAGGGRPNLREDAVPEGKAGLEGRHRRKPRVPPTARVDPADRFEHP
jgi:pimeloyl-ACP methyl ester carboxylesterase